MNHNVLVEIFTGLGAFHIPGVVANETSLVEFSTLWTEEGLSTSPFRAHLINLEHLKTEI